MPSRIELRYQNHLLLDTNSTLLKSTKPISDKDGTLFNYVTDGYIERLSLHVEFKDCELNSKTTVKSSRNVLLNQCKYRGLSYPEDADHNTLSAILHNNGWRIDCLKSGWNHSKYKQQLVRDDLNGRLLIVSGKPINKPLKGLLIITEKQFDEMLSFISANEALTQSALIQAIRSELYIPIPHLH